jgi:hypothetical protein
VVKRSEVESRFTAFTECYQLADPTRFSVVEEIFLSSVTRGTHSAHQRVHSERQQRG